MVDTPISIPLALRGAVAAVVGLGLAAVFFNEARELGGAALIALGLGPTLSELLDKNRSDIWEKNIHPFRANQQLALSLGTLFVSALMVAALFQRLENTAFVPSAFEDRYRNTWAPLLTHNFFVLLAGGLFAMLYRANGLMLLLAFNAAHWGTHFSDYVALVATTKGALTACGLIFALIPHALTEVLAYILAGMSGAFLSMAATKYAPSSKEFARVARACSYLLAIGLAFLIAAVSFEVLVAAPVFHEVIG